MNDLKAEVLIPSFNGRFLLEKHLSSVLEYSGIDTKVTVIDDGGTDDTSAFLKENYPAVKIIKNEKNLGFTKSVNRGFKEATSDLVVLLNNDVSPTSNYLDAAVRHFDNEQIFAVTLNEDTSSWPLISYKGKLQYTTGEEKDKPRYTAWASGGSAVFSRTVWEKLGGFDEVYSPGYWEDIDIGWRAWKAGYFIIWEPDSKVIHEHESTFGGLNKNFVNQIKQRNELIFNWKNITDSDLRKEHLSYVVKHTLSHPGYLKIVLSALMSYPTAMKDKDNVRSDRGVLDLVNQAIP